MMTEQELIKAIRGHKLVGVGSCSVIDECYSDSELWEKFGPEAGCNTIDEAIKKAVGREDLFIEQHLEHRFGDDDDRELQMRDEWEAMKQAAGWEHDK